MRACERHPPTEDSRLGLVRAQKEKKPIRGTHFLERVERDWDCPQIERSEIEMALTS